MWWLQPLRLLGLTDIVHFSTRGAVPLDNIFVPSISPYQAKKRAPLSSSDHNTILALPKIYSKIRRRDFLMVKQHISKVHDLSLDNIPILQASLQAMDFTLLSHPSLDRLVELVTNFLRQLFDLCCPLIKVYIYPDRVASRRLKEFRRTKEIFTPPWLRQHETVHRGDPISKVTILTLLLVINFDVAALNMYGAQSKDWPVNAVFSPPSSIWTNWIKSLYSSLISLLRYLFNKKMMIVLQWIRDYFSSRNQYDMCKSKRFLPLPNECGVV